MGRERESVEKHVGHEWGEWERVEKNVENE